MVTIVLFLLMAMPSNVLGDSGTCRYDIDRCSCRIGEANRGVCWDRDPLFKGLCYRRFCHSGWTCTCHSRTHVCFREYRSVPSVAVEDVHKSQALCASKSVPVVSGQDIALGHLRIHISKTGMLGNDCAEMAWWHNGELMGNHGAASDITTKSIDRELSIREEHAMLELRPGDLIAFRFRDSSYYCYKHLVEFSINGTVITTADARVTTYYARKYSRDWYLPSTALTPKNKGIGESETDLAKFIPLRKTKLTSNSAIVPGEDCWAPKNDSDPDNKKSEWYFRIQIPDAV